MKSMTGFGAATAVREGTRVTVELSAVNSKKSAELRFMVPREISTTIESVLRPVIQKKVSRGSLTVVVRYELGAALRLQQVVINEDALLAVIAHIRHAETNYDELLMQGMDRSSARDEVREEIDQLVAQWIVG